MMSCSVDNKHGAENIALIEKYVQAVQNLDYTTMENMLDDSYTGYGPSSNDSTDKALADRKSVV